MEVYKEYDKSIIHLPRQHLYFAEQTVKGNIIEVRIAI